MMRLSILEPPQPVDPFQEVTQWARDSTMALCLPSVVGGYAMGFIFSLFGSMISAETSTQCMGSKDFFKYSIRSASRLGANFAFFGFIFTGIEIALEKRRGRKDVWNPTASGAALGAFYGYRSYKLPGLVGGTVGGAAFSILFEKLMDMMGFMQH